MRFKGLGGTLEAVNVVIEWSVINRVVLSELF